MRSLHLATLEFLVLAIKTKQVQLARATGTPAWSALLCEFESLKRRLHLEFYYALDVAEGADENSP